MTTNEPKFNLKTIFVTMPINEARAFKALVIEKCSWNATIWFNKIHGKTPVAPLEQEAILRIQNKILNILNDDAN